MDVYLAARGIVAKGQLPGKPKSRFNDWANGGRRLKRMGVPYRLSAVETGRMCYDVRMGWLEIILLSIGATILAANQLLRDAPNITARFPSLTPRGRWNYVPFGLVALAGAVYLGRLAMSDETRPGPQPQMTLAERPSPPPSPAASDAPKAAQTDGPAVVEGIPVGRLVGYFENQTELDAERLIAPFVGAPVRVAGTVSSIEGVPGRRTIWLNERPVGNVRVALWLTENQDALAETIQARERVSAQCELARLGRSVVNLRRCLFVDEREISRPEIFRARVMPYRSPRPRRVPSIR